MDTSKYIKKCPRCGTEIEPDRYATKGNKTFGKAAAVSRALVGVACAGSIGAVIGAVAGYFADKATIMTIENEHDTNLWFKYKCPNPDCGSKWKEKRHTNDDPENPSWMMNVQIIVGIRNSQTIQLKK